LPVRWQEYELSRPRQYGACWLALERWRELGLDAFWTEKLGWPRAGTDWAKTLLVSVAYRLIAPGSEWKCWRLWYERTALGDLLGPEFHLGNQDQLYAVLDRLLPHRAELSTPAGALARSLRLEIRSASLRPHQHLLRGPGRRHPQGHLRL
jgi:hypothetical protein